ncbi:hypothetical protein GBAR_LOCUS12821 [Geodia barretti]|uniref:Uncharacterized protein n=1 Tax=Geodia barretti TaxID=519541 RepID=A0AA35S4A2_GEOBA|nr:hypothetical protein GBAR_LOCUS12821 [Geodia barretti]
MRKHTRKSTVPIRHKVQHITFVNEFACGVKHIHSTCETRLVYTLCVTDG